MIIFASDSLHEALLSVTKVRKSYAADTPDKPGKILRQEIFKQLLKVLSAEKELQPRNRDHTLLRLGSSGWV